MHSTQNQSQPNPTFSEEQYMDEDFVATHDQRVLDRSQWVAPEPEPTELDMLTDTLTDAFRRSYNRLAETHDEDDDFLPELAVQGASAVIRAMSTVMAAPEQPAAPEFDILPLATTGAKSSVAELSHGRLYVAVDTSGSVPTLYTTWVVEHEGKAYTHHQTVQAKPGG
jgi:hypothetical protein